MHGSYQEGGITEATSTSGSLNIALQSVVAALNVVAPCHPRYVNVNVDGIVLPVLCADYEHWRERQLLRAGSGKSVDP